MIWILAAAAAVLWLAHFVNGLIERAPTEEELWPGTLILVTELDVELPVTAAWPMGALMSTVSDIESLPEVIA